MIHLVAAEKTGEDKSSSAAAAKFKFWIFLEQMN